MRRLTNIVATAVLLVVLAFALGIWIIAKVPPLPPRRATAEVTAIAPPIGRVFATDAEIDLRNAHGTGQFTLAPDKVRCSVGDIVPVEQRGVTLSPVRETCR